MAGTQTHQRSRVIARDLPAAAPPRADLGAAQPSRPEGFVSIDGREMYCIRCFDRMPPFLMALASDSDLWMYVSSYGALTAGRCDEAHCLFPYETEDRLHYAHGVTGPITILRVRRHNHDQPALWEPFNHRCVAGPVQRNLYKSILSDDLLFEETHRELKLTFWYEWRASDEFGFVRTASLRNDDPTAAATIELLDGLLNVMPPGIPLITQQSAGSLADAYKRIELDEQTGLAVYSLSSIIHDRPEPAEYLKANVVWSHGLGSRCQILLSDEQVRAFRETGRASAEQVVTGRRGAFLLNSLMTLQPGQSVDWDIVADVDRDHVCIERLREALSREPDIRRRVLLSVWQSSENLQRNVAAADACQCTADRNATAHHAANVLFNNMRGGVPADQYRIELRDFIRFLDSRNRLIGAKHADSLSGLGARPLHAELLQHAEATEDPDLLRLAHEYLPLTFGRRHGDPSRPWNRFTIRVKNPDGSRAIRYEGNWRDIFQNWEALGLSFPQYIEHFIAKFVNASTIDGFNPYRVSSDGIDWETFDPDAPWSNIGYWGDHQIVYLLKFLEASQRHHPGLIQQLLLRPIFAYANVPYRLKPYAQIVEDPNNTIVFDRELDRAIQQRARRIGADGKLLPRGASEAVYHVNLCEKLLVPLLTKLCSLVFGGGIWMNTQRPEWNDANNALAGNGLSVVTLCHLRRYVHFLLELLRPMFDRQVEISTEVALWLDRTGATLLKYSDLLRETSIADRDRRRLLDDLGEIFTAYREQVYSGGFSGKSTCRIAELLPVLRLALGYLDHSIRSNRRDDGLYHAYNVLSLTRNGEASFERLYEMLEGQVAALSSGCLSGDETVELLDSLFKSRMYRADQDSLLLYPNRQLTPFLQHNRIPTQRVEQNPLLRALLEAKDDSIVRRDVNGCPRFSGEFRNADDLRLALNRLADRPVWRDLVASSGSSVLEIFEEVFHHRSFTGRSGAMYGYEGLGCVYWHMVCKLLLAVQESFWRAVHSLDSAPATIAALARSYYRIRDGLGFNKSATQFGAFPTDPYSHTPASGGARQPGMTGQVKEEILTRFGELGLLIDAGQIRFNPLLLRRREFLTEPASWTYFSVDGKQRSIDLDSSTLGFTYCQVPIVYRLTQADPLQIKLTLRDASTQTCGGDHLDASISSSIFNRDGAVQRVDVSIPSGLITL